MAATCRAVSTPKRLDSSLNLNNFRVWGLRVYRV